MSEPVLSLRIPNPFFEGRNQVYVIRSEPVTLIDTGIATQRAYDALVRELAEHGLAVRDIGRVVLTHKHIDHLGNAWRIQRESGAQVLIHQSDLPAVEHVDPSGRHSHEVVQERLRQWQTPPQQAESTKSFNFQWEIEPATATPIADGERLAQGAGELEVIHTPGHTIGSVCLRLGRQLFSGDHVLPTISPNIGAGDMRHGGLLKQYLQSLQRVQDIAPEIDQTLPGHGEPFDGLQQRCQKLLDHHHHRLRQVVEILRKNGPQSVYQMARRLYGDLQDFHVMLGCAEANAHLEFLITEGKVVADCDTDGNQVFRVAND